jgi:hypothetical protein
MPEVAPVIRAAGLVGEIIDHSRLCREKWHAIANLSAWGVGPPIRFEHLLAAKE